MEDEIPGGKEVVAARPKAIVVFGMHAINEELAARAAARIEHSAVPYSTDVSFSQHDPGLCYVDAYEAAKAHADVTSPKFRDIYKEEAIKRLKEGYQRTQTIAETHANAVVIDVHETNSETNPQLFKDGEGLIIHPCLGEDQAERLKKRLREVLPKGKNEEFPIIVSGEHDKVFAALWRDGAIPTNYITVELITNAVLLISVAEEEGAAVSEYSSGSELNRLNNTMPIGEVSHEVTKQARLLELIIPVIAAFYREEGIVVENKSPAEKSQIPS